MAGQTQRIGSSRRDRVREDQTIKSRIWRSLVRIVTKSFQPSKTAKSSIQARSVTRCGPYRFISRNSDINVVREFMRSLGQRLTPIVLRSDPDITSPHYRGSGRSSNRRLRGASRIRRSAFSASSTSTERERIALGERTSLVENGGGRFVATNNQVLQGRARGHRNSGSKTQPLQRAARRGTPSADDACLKL